MKALPSMLCSTPFSPLELFMLYIVFVAGGGEGLTKHAVFIPPLLPWNCLCYILFLWQVAVKALPSRDVFISLLAVPGEKSEGTDFLHSLMSDMENYVTALGEILRILDDFYRVNTLENEEPV